MQLTYADFVEVDPNVFAKQKERQIFAGSFNECQKMLPYINGNVDMLRTNNFDTNEIICGFFRKSASRG